MLDFRCFVLLDSFLADGALARIPKQRHGRSRLAMFGGVAWYGHSSCPMIPEGRS